MKKKLAVVVLVATSVVIAAIGCKRKEESEGKYRIAVIPKGTTHEFWKSIHAGAVKAMQELNDSGLEVEIIWKGPLKEDDRCSDQYNYCQRFFHSYHFLNLPYDNSGLPARS